MKLLFVFADSSPKVSIIAIGVISASCETHSSPARRTIGLAKGRIFSPSRTSTGTHPSPARRTIGLVETREVYASC
ncbi:25242_t:CDS:2 [Cetraspora pellucida]|uniref:25242_t:CDS:1 n=1 Tax=Cetraspora pellucida TaxID=1433469 RepID=A0A9N8Z6A6_9GLOM|nr:25242_t:CDS:2 [Cetraspora pellucida]